MTPGTCVMSGCSPAAEAVSVHRSLLNVSSVAGPTPGTAAGEGRGGVVTGAAVVVVVVVLLVGLLVLLVAAGTRMGRWGRLVRFLCGCQNAGGVGGSGVTV